MKSIKRILSLLLAMVMLLGMIPTSVSAASKSIVQKRIESIAKVYPQGSIFNEWVTVGTHGYYIQQYGGCSGLMSYITEKVFDIPFCCKECGGYKSIGSASTSNTSAMKKLFAKAKIGDVIEWTSKSSVSHHAIFLSDNKNGIKIYEANFLGPRKLDNEVWYNHQWNWSVMKTWPAGGANKVTVYRANNYTSVNKGKSAKEAAKGKIYTISSQDKLKIKVLNSSIGKSTAVVLSGYKKGATIPKYVAVSNNQVVRTLNSKSEYKDADANCFRIYTVTKEPSITSKVSASKTSKTIKLSWNKVSGANGYIVYRYDTKKKKYVTLKSSITAKSYTIKGLKPNTKYKFLVKAYKKVNGITITSSKGKSITVTTKK